MFAFYSSFSRPQQMPAVVAVAAVAAAEEVVAVELAYWVRDWVRKPSDQVWVRELSGAWAGSVDLERRSRAKVISCWPS